MTLHQTPIARCYGELFAIIRATAAALPDDARAGVDLADFREWTEGEPAEIIDHYSVNSIPGRSWCESLQSIARPQVALHGPRADWGLILVRYELDGARGSFKVANSRAALLRLAEKIGTLPGGRAVLRAEKPAKPRPAVSWPAVSWPAVSVKVWREQLEDGAAADALAIGLGKLGGRVYQQGGRAAYMIVAPVPIDGMPDGFATGRRDDGKWCGFDTQSGFSIGCKYGAHGSRASAEKAALQGWQDADDDKRAHVLAQARAAAADADQAAALAEWCKARGLEQFEAPADVAPDADPAELAQHAPADAPTAAPVDLAATAPADIGAALLAVARRLTAKPGRADPAAPASAPAAPIDQAPAARPVVYRFPLILVGTDSHRITETMHDGAGPGLTSADIAAADVAARAMAAARGLRVVESGFTSGAARAWCAPIEAPAAPDPAPAAPAAGQTAPAAIVRAAEALARISADWAPDAGRSHAMAGGRAGLSEHLPRILADLRRAASHGFGLEKTEARRALAEFDAAAPAGAPAAPAAAAPRQSAPVLPLFARIALDRLQCSADLRSPAQLAELLSDYARIHGTRCDDETAAAVLAQCAARWPDQFNPAAADPAPAADPGPAAGAALADAAAPAAPAEVNPADLAEVKAAAGADDAAAPAGCTPYPGIPDGAPALHDPAPWRGADNAAARARVYAVHVRTAAASQAMAPTWHSAGLHLRRSVNEAGFDAQSRALRAALAAQLRADRAAARLAADVVHPADDAPAEAVAPAATPYRAIQDPAPAGQDPAVDAMAADVAEWLAKTWPHLADDPRPRAGLTLAAQNERQRAARIHGHYAEIARACADSLQARADALPVPPAATRAHTPFDGFGGEWNNIRTGRAEPDEYRAHLIEAMKAAQAAGLFYNADTYPRAAAIMAARWGYPDLREADPWPHNDHVPGWFGSHCYMAGDVIRAREVREAARETREGLRLAVGVKLGALVFNDYKLTRGAEVAEVSDDGEQVTITGNRGAAAVRIQCAPLAVRGAIKRAHENGKRRDSYAEFCAGRPAPVAAAIVAPVADPEPASLADRILAELASRAPGDILTARGLAVYCGDRNPTPEELQPWADACAELAAVGRLVLFDYSAQGQPAGYALPYLAPAATGAPCPENQNSAEPAAIQAEPGDIAAARRIGGEDWHRGDAMRNEAAMRTGGHWNAAEWAAYCEGYEAAADSAANVAEAVASAYGDSTDPATLADIKEAHDLAAALAATVDRATSRGPVAVRLLRSQAARIRSHAGGQPVRVAARYLVASAMLAALALRRAADLAEPAGLPAGPVPIKPARILRAAQHLQPGARRAAPVAAGGAGAIDRPGPTCYPWRTACTAGQLARPPPGR